MMKVYRKRDFPVSKVRRFLEPGPIVLVSSAWKGERDIMRQRQPEAVLQAGDAGRLIFG